MDNRISKTLNHRVPNILIIMADQLRRCSLSVYGDPNIETPHIDALARSGVRFSQANTTYPICVPARFTFMTGETAHSRFIPSIEWRMSPAETTLADYFNAAGYHTCYIGKWHLHGGHGVLPGHTEEKTNRTPIPPSHQGRWQKWLGFDVANNPWKTHYFEDADPVPKRLEGYQTDGLTDLAIQYLKTRGIEDDPFCCVLSVEPPHFPMQAPPELEEKWLNTEIVLPDNFYFCDSRPSPGVKLTDKERSAAIRHIQLYYAMLENLDQNVGRLMAALKDSPHSESTVVVFLSDHGEMQGAHCEPYQIKDHPYEESVGIPLFVSDPRLQNRRNFELSTPTCMEDLVPTLLGLAGIAIPENLPGADLSPLVRGEREALERPGVMLEFVHDLRTGRRWPHPYNAQYWRAFRSKRYKYTVLGGAGGGSPWQFYDLETDPLEMNNLVDSEEHQNLIAQHHHWLYERMLETEDHFVLLPSHGCPGLNVWQDTAALERFL